MKPILLLSLCFALLNSACHKAKTDSNGLPAATQDGKNTLGFMLNGQAWTPQGYNGTANLSLYYDPTLSGGVFNLAAYKILNSTSGKRQRITIFGDSIQGPQKILLPNKEKIGFIFYDDETGCEFISNNSTVIISNGFFDIQKLDKNNHVCSGEFEFSFKKTSCGDVQISKGRFDMKY